MSGALTYLRTFASGIKLYLRTTAENGSWKRIPGVTDEEYFSNLVGNRVEEESSQHIAAIVARFGKAPERAVIE